MSRRKRARASDPMGLVGWVFADLLLGLAIVFLATQPGDPSAAAATPDTTTTVTTVPTGVDREFACLRVTTDPGILTGTPGPQRDAHVAVLADQVRVALESASLDGRQAGIVLSFGVAQTPGEGKAIADSFNRLVLPLIPEVFERSAARPFWDGGPKAGAPRGSVGVNLCPLNNGDQPPLQPAPPC